MCQQAFGKCSAQVLMGVQRLSQPGSYRITGA